MPLFVTILSFTVAAVSCRLRREAVHGGLRTHLPTLKQESLLGTGLILGIRAGLLLANLQHRVGLEVGSLAAAAAAATSIRRSLLLADLQHRVGLKVWQRLSVFHH